MGALSLNMAALGFGGKWPQMSLTNLLIDLAKVCQVNMGFPNDKQTLTRRKGIKVVCMLDYSLEILWKI